MATVRGIRVRSHLRVPGFSTRSVRHVATSAPSGYLPALITAETDSEGTGYLATGCSETFLCIGDGRRRGQSWHLPRPLAFLKKRIKIGNSSKYT